MKLFNLLGNLFYIYVAIIGLNFKTMKKVCVFLLLFLLNTAFAQQSKQNYNWLVSGLFPGPSPSNGPSLNFEDCEANILGNAAGFQFEGQTAISDSLTGQLLFYSNGLQVFNALGQVMPNGSQVGITNSKAQNLIVKKPGGGTLYYLFIPEPQAGVVTNTLIPGLNGFSYSIIDMSLNGGLGGVVSSANLLMPLGNCEMVTGVYHQNGQDIWIIGHQYGSNAFFAFLLTSQGISSGPIFSNVGPTLLTFQPGNYATSNYDAIGELKASPDGNKLAFTTFYNGYTCLVDFDKSTGQITNPIDLNLGSAGYGTSFSQDNSKLYFSRVDPTQGGVSFLVGGSLVQFDISSNDPAIIQASMIEIFSSGTGFRSLKLGPDGKIYVARTTLVAGGNGASYLGVINNPNESGLACNYVNDGVFIGTNNGRWGLNNAIEDFYSCEEFEFSLGPDLNTCLGDSITLTAPANQLAYLWNTGATTNSIVVNQSGTYWVTVTSFTGTATDTIVVTNFAQQNILISGQNELCIGDSTTLTASPGFSNYLWNNGAQTQDVFVGEGNYQVTAVDVNGCLSSDSISITELPSPVINFTGETIICLGETTTLTAGPGFLSYIWSNDETQAQINVGSGSYQVTVVDSSGCQASSEISVTTSSPIAAFVISDNPINGEGTIFNLQNTSISNSSAIVAWNWNFGDGNLSNVENPTHSYEHVGQYEIQLIITNALGCVDTAYITVEVTGAIVIPNVVTPNGDGVNDVFLIQNLDKNKASKLVVLNRWGNVVFESENYQNDWIPNSLVDGVYFYLFTLADTEKFTGFISVFSSGE